MKSQVTLSNLMMEWDELFDEYLSQPTPVLIQRIKDASDMAGEGDFAGAVYSSEPNYATYWNAVAVEQREIASICELELIERGFETH